MIGAVLQVAERSIPPPLSFGGVHSEPMLLQGYYFVDRNSRFDVALWQETDTGKRNRVQMVLGISDSEVESLQGLVETGQFKLVQEADAESFF